MFRRVTPGHQPRHRAQPGAGPRRQPARGPAARLLRDDARRASRARWAWSPRSRPTPPRAGTWPPPAPATCSPRATWTPTRSAATSPASPTGSARRSPRCTARWPRSSARRRTRSRSTPCWSGCSGGGVGAGLRAVPAADRGALPQAGRGDDHRPAGSRRPAPRAGAARCARRHPCHQCQVGSNPYPFVGLNHFTVPIATDNLPLSQWWQPKSIARHAATLPKGQ